MAGFDRSQELPSSVRYRVVAICSLMSVLLYLDRFCVSFAEVYIKQDLGLSEYAVSLMFSAFFLTYALGQPASGWLGDRCGGRTMLTLYIFAWSLFTGAIGFAQGLAVLVALRLGLGLAQAGAYPTAATLIAKWVPPTRRGMASSLVALGGRVGGVLSLFVTGFVMLFFTPVEIPSTFTARDILHEYRLAHELVHGNRPPDRARELPAANIRGSDGGTQAIVGQRLLGEFPTGVRADVEAAAAHYREFPASHAGTSPPPAMPPLLPSAAPSPASAPLPAGRLRVDLAEALNHAVRKVDFFSRVELGDVKLEHEAVQLLGRNQVDLSPNQIQRLNRLVLEAVYPASIRKVYGAGWRHMMILYGALGLPVTWLFWWICRDEPRKHPQCNDAERALIEAGRLEAHRRPVGGLPLRQLVANRSMWFNGAMQFFTNVGWVFFMTYLPRYFVEVHATPVAQRSWISAIPAMAACGGMFLGGIVTDPAVRWWGRRWGRSLPIALTRFAAGATYLICLFHPSPWTAVAILAVTSLLCDVGIPAIWAFQQDVGGKYAGSVLGWGNMWGNLGAVVGPTLIGTIVGTSANWNIVFTACALAFFLSGLAALGIDATASLGGDDSGQQA